MNKIFFFFILFLPAMSLSADESPTAIIQGLWQELQTIRSSQSGLSEEQEEFVRRAIQRRYDFKAFAVRSLQDYWDTWSLDRQQEVLARFETLFVRGVLRQMKKVLKPSVTIISRGFTIVRRGKEARGSFVGKEGGDEVSFDVFYTGGNSGWKICDVEIEGALLSRNYRGHFNKILGTEGYTGLLARLENKEGGSL